MDTKYNGWANYETWCVALWLNNEEASYRYWREMAQQAAKQSPEASQVKQGLWSAEEAARNSLAEQLCEQVSDSPKVKDSDLFTDLLIEALDAVDWNEIAEELLEDFFTEIPDVCATSLPCQPNKSDFRFETGRLVVTPGALDALTQNAIDAALARHVRGDWGLVGAEDAQVNELALREGSRLLSVYEDSEGTRFWVITEADRSSTTILLPDEY